MKIKFTILLMIVGLMSLHTFAQQDPQFTQFMNNKLFYNPGFAGSSKDKICVNATYRTQWVGYGGGTAFTPEGTGAKPVGQGDAPSTQNFGIHGNIGRIGLGLNIWNDQLGFSSTLSPTFSLSYIQPFDNGASLAGGVGVGIVQKGLNGSKLVAIDPGDPLIPTGDITGNALNLDFGVYYTMPQLSIFNDFYFGASTLHINSPVVSLDKNGYSGKAYQDKHYYLMTGATYQLGTIDLKPNIMYKTDGVKHSFDLNCLAEYQQKLIGGVSYRTPQEFSILAGYNFFSNSANPLQLMYSYDLITSDIISYSSGSHEISLRYCFGFKFTSKPPKAIFPIKTPRKL
jgi:type IX secretion system PorP/SprF family membrane protein